MTAFPQRSASQMGNFVINPSGSEPGTEEVWLRDRAWWALSMMPLWGLPEARGENPVIPEVAGRRATERFLDQGVYVVEMRMTGAVDASGNSSVTPFSTLRSHRDYWRTNVLTVNGNGGTQRNGLLVLPDATSILDVFQFSIRFGAQRGADVLAVLEVVAVSGEIGGLPDG